MTVTELEPAVAAIHIPPLSNDFLRRVRTEGIDDQGQPVRRLTAEGGEPCRDVLRRAVAGEELILASHSPFALSGPYREFGPVFVLASDSSEAPARDRLPLHGYLRDYFVIRAYSANEEILDAVLTTPSIAAATVDEFLQNPETAFLHVRFPTYGCFALRIDRSSFDSRTEPARVS
jgi:hypothetical protein